MTPALELAETPTSPAQQQTSDRTQQPKEVDAARAANEEDALIGTSGARSDSRSDGRSTWFSRRIQIFGASVSVKYGKGVAVTLMWRPGAPCIGLAS